MSAESLTQAIRRLAAHESLDAESVRRAFGVIMRGEGTPVQVAVATIVSDADAYAEEVAATLRAAGLAVVLDLSNQKINAKVREHSLAHVPVIAVVGRKEAEQGTVALRRLGGDAQEVDAGGGVLGLQRERAGCPSCRWIQNRERATKRQYLRADECLSAVGSSAHHREVDPAP